MTRSTTDPQRLTRRTMLTGLAGGAGLVAVSLAGCSSGGPAGGEGEHSTPDPDRPHESPMLTEQVEAGELPPLEERLPVAEDRLVVDAPAFGIYGGTYQGAIAGAEDHPWLSRTIGFEPMLRPSLDLAEDGHPGTLKSIEFDEDDGTVYTLHLREGMRWSDGEPVTADDVMFGIEEVFFNEDIFTNPPEILAVDNEPCTAEKLDDYTVRLTYPASKGNVIDLASRSGTFFDHPKHYLQDFLPHLNERANEIAEEAGYTDWEDHWDAVNEWFDNPDKPTLNAWVLQTALNDGGVIVAERNPYYWKTDSDGAQLPFIDRMEFEVVAEDEVMLMKALNGEIDFHSRHFNSMANRPVLAEGRDAGDYDFVTIESSFSNQLIISLNFNHEDEVLQEIFRNRDFRIGLSHAIDRQEIIDTAYQRQGTPSQVAPRPESDFYDEEFATQYTEYDVDLANQYLDDAGYSETDSSGYRLRPDGDRITFNIDVINLTPEWPTATEMVTQYWDEVGIDARVNTIERTLFLDRKDPAANQHDANVWYGEGGLHEEMIETRWWFPGHWESNYATGWAEWYTSRGTSEYAVEPPDDVKAQMTLMREILAEPDEDVSNEKFREILQIAKEQFYVIGIMQPFDGYAIKKNDLHNVEVFSDVVVWQAPAYTNPSTWFFDR